MSTPAVSATTTSAQLVKMANGEYTAASVAADEKAATALGLVKEKDGNYGTSAPAPASTDTKSSSNVLSALSSMKLGGPDKAQDAAAQYADGA
jgi:hypothetical protein